MRRLILLLVLTFPFLGLHCQNWLPCGAGTNNGYNGGVTLKSFNGKLIAGGAFNQAGNVEARGSAMWDGTNWSVVDTSMNIFFAVRCLVVYRGELYGFAKESNPPGTYMIKLDSTFKWHVVPNSNFYLGNYEGFVRSAAVYNDELYVAGNFDSVADIGANHIAKWDGTNWSTFGTGFDDEYILEMTVFQNELYVGGRFSDIDGLAVSNVAKWNGTNWSDVGGGLEPDHGACNTMAIFEDDLYIGGDFHFAGGEPISYLTRWDGNSFSMVGDGFEFAGDPISMHPFADVLVLGGYFENGLFENDAGVWDGEDFYTLGTGINAAPTHFEIYDNYLHAGGRFNGEGVANGVAILDVEDHTVSTLEYDAPSHSLSIAPNPFFRETTLKIEPPLMDGTLTLFDSLGNQVREIEPIQAGSINLYREQLSAGLYYVRLVQQDQIIGKNKILIID